MKHIIMAVMLLAFTLLSANPTYFPTTTLAEDFGASWCPGCVTAWQGLQVLHSQTHSGEFVCARLYTESGDLSNPIVQDRFGYYEINGVPAVVFNGKITIPGSDVGIGDGSLYLQALKQFRYSASPLKMSVSTFNSVSGQFAGEIKMISPTENISGAKVVYVLLEDNVSADATHVVRTILYDEDFNLSGAGSVYSFDRSFTLNPSWNTTNLWAIAAVQLSNKAIVQCTSSLPLPTYNFRAAMNWNPSVEGAANTSYLSSPFWLFNLGASDSYTMRIVVDQAPEDWYFNYCDEEGNCYPGNIDRPFSLGTNEAEAFHLNLWIGSPGFAYYRMVISSPNLGEYSIPFHYKVEGVENSDSNLTPPAVTMGKVSPNPASRQASLSIFSGKNGETTGVDIYNLKGQKVQSIACPGLVQGENRIDLQLNDLPNGVYFYRLQNSPQTAQRFVLIK